MHYCIVVITDQFPSNQVLEEKLAPFNENAFYAQFEDENGEGEIPEGVARPQFTWDWWQVGGRYNGLLKLKCEQAEEESENEYRWLFYANEPRAGRLYRSQMLEELRKVKEKYHLGFQIADEEDYYGYLGRRDGYLRVDGGKIKDLIDFEETIVNHSWGFIGKDGTAYSRSYWNGHDFVSDEQYEEKVRKAIKDVGDCYACYIDIHD